MQANQHKSEAGNDYEVSFGKKYDLNVTADDLARYGE